MAMLELVMQHKLNGVSYTANLKNSLRYPYNEYVEIEFKGAVTSFVLKTLIEYFCVDLLDGGIYLTGVRHSSFILKALDITLKK